MENKHRSIPLAKNGQREVSHFVGQELLFDYLIDKLDPIRKKAVSDHVKFSREAQLDLEKMQLGLQYVDQLARTNVSNSVLEEISEPTTYVTELFKKTRFDKWPTGVKWGLEALVIVGVIVTVLVAVPWDKMMNALPGRGSEDIILAEVSRNGGDTQVGAVEEPGQFQDEGIKTSAPLQAAQEAQKEIDAKKAEQLAAKPTTSGTPTSLTGLDKKAEDAAKKAPINAANTAVAATSGAALPKGIPEAQSGGFLFRGDLSVTNLDAGVPKLTSKIEELGGRKAGDVSLGWRKGPASAYFHFTIPAAKYADLAQFMANYGKLRLSKEKHPRVMPDGIIRLIITAEEAKK